MWKIPILRPRLESDENIKALEKELAMVKTSASKKSTNLQASEKSCSELKEALDKSRMDVLNVGNVDFDQEKAQAICLYQISTSRRLIFSRLQWM